MSQPLVSVLMPCYNAEDHLEAAMRSILDQTYSNLEIIAINDCSKDKTSEILHRMASGDSRIKVVDNEENLQLIKTLNKGVNLCSGEYIARMDSDDIALPQRIEKEVSFLEENKDHDIVSSLFLAFPTDNPSKKDLHHNPLLHQELKAYMLFKSGICHPAVMIRKRIFSELGLEFEMEYLHVEDYALWSKAIYKTKIANIGEPLLLYRVHPNQVSSLNEQLQIDNKKKVFKIHCLQLGLPTDDESLNIYASIAEAVPYIKSEDYLRKCNAFMQRLLEINQQQSFCDSKYLKDLLAIHWLRLCANSQLGLKAIKTLKNSSIYNKDTYSTKDILILYFKCLFKIEYRKSFIYKILFR